MQLFSILIITAYFSLIASTVLGAVYFNKLSKPLKRFFVYLSGKFLLEGLSELINWLGFENLWVLEVNLFFEFALMLWIFKAVFKPSKLWWWNFYTSVSFMLLALLRIPGLVYFVDNETAGLISNLLVHSTVIFLAFKYFYHHIQLDFGSQRSEFFWINAALLCYFSSTLIGDLAFSNFLQQSAEIASRLWMINLLITIGFYTLSGIVFINRAKHSR